MIYQYVRVMLLELMINIRWMFSSHGLSMFVNWFHEFVVFDRSAAQLGFNVLDSFLLFVRGCIAEDEIHVLKRLLELAYLIQKRYTNWGFSPCLGFRAHRRS